MTVIEKAVQWAINTANDNSHGYSQADRWGPDYDCSSFVITAYQQAGLALREAGASYTGNMRNAFLSCGFFDATNLVNLGSGGGIQAGDVLLNYSAHTCIAIGAGRVANCRTDEGHPQAGDQSGNEIRLQSYWNYPWNCVLRYKEKLATNLQPVANPVASDTATVTLPVTQKEDHELVLKTLQRKTNYDQNVILLQILLTLRNFPCGAIDGYFGEKTESALKKFQIWANILPVDGTCGLTTWEKLGVVAK